jgi:hypothetical protein
MVNSVRGKISRLTRQSIIGLGRVSPPVFAKGKSRACERQPDLTHFLPCAIGPLRDPNNGWTRVQNCSASSPDRPPRDFCSALLPCSVRGSRTFHFRAAAAQIDGNQKPPRDLDDLFHITRTSKCEGTENLRPLVCMTGGTIAENRLRERSPRNDHLNHFKNIDPRTRGSGGNIRGQPHA